MGMPKRHQLPQLVAAGGAGAAAGTILSHYPIVGEVVGIGLQYGGTVTTQDVTILTKALPVMTVLAVANNATSGWFFPQAQVCSPATGVGLTFDGTHPVVDELNIVDYIEVRLGGANPGDTLDVTLLTE